MADFYARLKTLSHEQRALLACWLARQRPQATPEAARVPDSAGQRLVAYVVPQQPNAPPDASDLRHFLQRHLPDYMVPSAFVLLDALPRTPNGKVDRNALPTEDAAAAPGEPSYEAPRTPVEAQLAAIWAEVLGLDLIGIHDNFFEIGGDSILSIQILSRANQAGLPLRARQLFEYQTIAALAEHIETIRWAREQAAQAPDASHDGEDFVL